MKNLIKLSLVVALVVACGSASAVFVDNPNTLALYHCDATNWAGATETTPDDNSSGRTAHDAIINQAGEGTLVAGSPYGGSSLSLTRTDQAVGVGVMVTDPQVLMSDLAFKAASFPADGAYNVLMFLQPMQNMLFGSGGSTYVRIVTYDDAGSGYYLQSSLALSLDTWYTVSAVYSNNTTTVIVGNDTEGYFTNSMAIGGTGLYDGMDDVPLGYHAFAPTSEAWHFDGELDEIKISTIPEPFTFGLIGLVGLFFIRKK